jgi:hypothetical protein
VYVWAHSVSMCIDPIYPMYVYMPCMYICLICIYVIYRMCEILLLSTIGYIIKANRNRVVYMAERIIRLYLLNSHY